jgi:adenylyltransferase and sulfurtransferase
MNERLLMYDSLQCSFFNIKKPKKQENCPVCSGPDIAKILSMEDSDKNLQSARGPANCSYLPAILDDQYQISCQEFYKLQTQQDQQYVLLDVRVKEQFDLCALEKAINIPLERLNENFERIETLSNGWTTPIYCVCRRGIFSVEATNLLNKYISDTTKDKADVKPAKNIRGGLEAWRKVVDDKFPKY